MPWITILGIYTLIVFGLLAAGADDTHTRRERWEMRSAAILWPLYHIPWRGSGKHLQRVRMIAHG